MKRKAPRTQPSHVHAARPQRRPRQARHRDQRRRRAPSSNGCARAIWDRCRSSSGLVIIWTVFTSLNPVFLSADNLVNLLFDCSTVGVISLGIVCVLMVGQIDLSVGSISGFASALVGMLWVNHGWPVLLAIVAAVAVGALIGVLYALLLNRFGMPSFVATLAGLLAILGLQLYVLGATGSINLPYGSTLVNFGQLMIIPAVVSYLPRAGAGRRDPGDRAAHARAPPARPISRRPRWAACSSRSRRDHGAAGGRGRLPQPGTRRSADVRPLPRPRGRDGLRADADALGPVDERGRRQSRGRAARRHQCRRASTPAPSCCAPVSPRSAAC